MYSYIRGELAEINSDHIVVDVSGIGYQIFIPGQSMNYLPCMGEEIKVHTYLEAISLPDELVSQQAIPAPSRIRICCLGIKV